MLSEFFVGNWILNNFYFNLFYIIIDILCSTESLSQSIFLFQYIIIFQTWQSFKLLSSTPGGDKHVRQRIFCRKWNSQQLLFQDFFHIIGISGSVEPQSQSIFLFQYIIQFQTWQSFEPSSSTLRRDRHVCPLSFL